MLAALLFDDDCGMKNNISCYQQINSESISLCSHRARAVDTMFRTVRSRCICAHASSALAIVASLKSSSRSRDNNTQCDTSRCFGSAALQTRKLPLGLESLYERKVLCSFVLGSVDVYLVGTAHIARQSQDDVDLVLRTIRPTTIFLELDSQRANFLISSLDSKSKEPKISVLSVLLTVAALRREYSLSTLQSLCLILYKIADDKYGGEKGGDLKAALRYRKEHGQDCVLGDRPVDVTIHRGWEAFNVFEKCKLVLGLAYKVIKPVDHFKEIENMNNVLQGDDQAREHFLDEIRMPFPKLYTVLVDERDQWLTAKLVQTCRELQGWRRQSVVAVVGVGHLEGMARLLLDKNSSLDDRCETILTGLGRVQKFADNPKKAAELSVFAHEIMKLS
jgi:pheromone shutdown protein TraB